MIQYIAPQTARSCFLDGRLPRLRHFCCIDGENGRLPRAMHAHSDYAELVYIYSGRGRHMIGDGAYNTQAGDLLFFDAGVPHDERAEPGGEIHYYNIGITGLHLHERRANAIIGDRFEPVLHAGAVGARVETLCRLLHDELRRGRALSGDICRFLMLPILLDVLALVDTNAAPRAPQESTLGGRVQQYVDLHYRENLTLAAIAEAAQVSPYYLARLFREKTGYSPIQYIINRRMGEAQSLLISTKLPVIRIAERVGYDNPNYFSLLFKRSVGMTPMQYRRSTCADNDKNMSLYTSDMTSI